MVFYRKYRPQTIEQLDSEAVKKTLRSVLSSETIPHALLFTGPKGLGKTSTARIVAKYVNCLATTESKKKNVVIPCNACTSCISITEGTNLDVLEIDAASNRGIDEMRELREKMRLLPVSSHKKVYIIDEVHMLTTEAFNAILKTLEEPPAHAMFILCTTEVHKLPATIISRCFHLQFTKATTTDLVHAFERIVQSEHIDAEPDALFAIASLADGSFRDGTKLLEAIVLAEKGKKLTKELVESFSHAGSIDTAITGLLASFVAFDTKKGLAVIQQLGDEGVDMKYFVEKLLLFLHTDLLITSGISTERKAYIADIHTIKQLVAIFSQVYMEVKTAVIPQLPLELAIIEWSEGKKEHVQTEGSKEEVKVVSKKEQAVEEIHKEQSSSAKPSMPLLYQLLDSIKTEHHMIAGVLRSCKIHETDETVIIEAPSLFHKQRLEEKKTLEILEKVCENITGKKRMVSITLKSTN